MRSREEIERATREVLATVIKPELINDWFVTVVPALGGKRPIDVLGTEDRERVYALACALRDGAFM